jgi:dimethylamine/trimethylamine dehydrogenase
LIEAESELGGHLRNVAALPGLAEWFRVVSFREAELHRLATVEVLRGTGRATAEEILDFGCAKVVLATGARWNGDGRGAAGPDPIKGIDANLPGFITPEQLFSGKEVGDSVAVLDSDGYFMGVSLAELLADRGKKVTLITLFDRVAPYTDYTLEGPNLRRMLREKGVVSRAGNWIERAENGSRMVLQLYDIYRDGWKRTDDPRLGVLPRPTGNDTEALAFDTVVLCTGRHSENSHYRDLVLRKSDWARNGITGVYRAGDCLAPRYIADAVFDGHRMGREIDSGDPQRPRAIIRERQIWGGETWPKLNDPVL